MKKVIQNVLAQNSNNKIAYLCGRCKKEVGKKDSVCRHCGAKLGNIKCPFCNFTGDVNDFKYDTCPKCGRKNKIVSLNIRNDMKKNNAILYLTNLTAVQFWSLFAFLIVILIFLILTFFYYFDLI